MTKSQAKYQITSNQVSSNISNSTIILNHKDGIYYELNEVGSIIWEQLKTKAVSFDELKDIILGEFDVDEKIAESDINSILNELLNEKLVEII